MLFHFNITLTEEDYLAFNNFHSFESKHGRKAIRKSRIFFIAIMALLIALMFFIQGVTTFSLIYTALLGVYTIVYMLLFRKVLNKNIKSQIKRLKKLGKLPYEPISTLEFYEDKMVEITTSARTEQSYDVFERLCIVANRYILLYRSSVGAYILPMAQIKSQANLDDLLYFLSQKCNTVEHY